MNIQTVELPPSAQALPVIRQSLPDSKAFSKISASNIGGYAESHAKLTVRETKPPEPEGEPPRLITPLNQVNANEGEMAFFSCHVDGQPLPKFCWSSWTEKVWPFLRWNNNQKIRTGQDRNGQDRTGQYRTQNQIKTNKRKKN